MLKKSENKIWEQKFQKIWEIELQNFGNKNPGTKI
jgi:hypothetical protein